MKLALKGSMRKGCRRSERGFTLIEIIMVVALIIILVAIAIPSILTYVRNYQIRGAQQQVAGDLTAARLKAITKNVNLGVVFAVGVFPAYPAQSFRWVVEDDLHPQTPPLPPWTNIPGEENGGGFPALLADPAQAGPVRVLPAQVRFVNPALCGAGAPTDWGLRFNRLGGMCGVNSGGAGCGPTPPGPGYPFIINVAAGTATICLQELFSNNLRRVAVVAGGRVLTQ
jgi:prepilin-type N-terminal cleavage/methylation domain-containing protein